MRMLLSRILIVLGVIGFIFAPPVFLGYIKLYQAELAVRALDYRRASEAFERSAALLPWRHDLWERAGASQVRLGNFKEAIHILAIAKGRGALSDVGWDELGLSYYKMGYLDEAVETWLDGLKVYPSYEAYYSHLTFAYRDQGNTLAEKDALRKWIDTGGGSDAWNHYRLGLLLAVSEPDSALGEFLLASSLDPVYDPVLETMRTAFNLASFETDESRRLVIIGRGLGIVDEWSLAAEAFHQAVSADRSNAEAWAWLGEAEGQLNRGGGAELDKALSLDPGNPIVRSLRGLYWTRQDRPDQALAEFLLTAEYDPENPAWRISIGEAYSLKGDLQAALQSYLDAVELAPSEWHFWRLLANFCAQYDMQVEEYGLPAAQTAVELSGDNPLTLDTLGVTLMSLRRYEEAQDALEHALRLNPELALPHLHLGMLALQQDDWEAARDHFLQARDLDPGGPVGEQAQRLLDQYFP